MKDIFTLNPNPLTRFLEKPNQDFTKSDLIRFIESNGIEMINFHYAGADGRLKTLSFVIGSRKHLDSILSAGERVDGSNLFPNYVKAGSSDLYVIPRYRATFVNHFQRFLRWISFVHIMIRMGYLLKIHPNTSLKNRTRYSRKRRG